LVDNSGMTCRAEQRQQEHAAVRKHRNDEAAN
jgi:hypothetical protein